MELPKIGEYQFSPPENIGTWAAFETPMISAMARESHYQEISDAVQEMLRHIPELAGVGISIRFINIKSEDGNPHGERGKFRMVLERLNKPIPNVAVGEDNKSFPQKQTGEFIAINEDGNGTCAHVCVPDSWPEDSVLGFAAREAKQRHGIEGIAHKVKSRKCPSRPGCIHYTFSTEAHA